MMFFLSRWPAGWSRQSRCSLAIALGVVLLLLLMCFIDIPLSRMPEPIAENAELFAEGSRITVYLTLVSGVAGLVLGVLGALGRLSSIPPIRWIASFYIWVIRGTPLLVQVLFVFLALPGLLPFWDVIFPQAFKIALPPLVNNFIALLKDSSLAYAIGVVELTNVANRIQSSTFQPIPPLVTAAVIYLLLTTVLTQISTAVEHRMDVEGRQK